MRIFSITTSDPVEIGGITYDTAGLAVVDELEWDRLYKRFLGGEASEDDLLAAIPIVQKCVPGFDVTSLGGADLIRLGMLLIKGSDLGNASGVATTSQTSQPSSHGPSDATPAKSSPGQRKKSGSGRIAPTK